MSRNPATLVLILALALPAHGAEPKGVLLDDVVAVVNQHVITRSEVWDEARLILVERRGQAGLKSQVTPLFLKQVLDMLINQRVLLDEARRVGLPALAEEEKEALREGFRRHFVDREAYVRFLLGNGLTESSISDALERHLRVKRLREKKLRVMPEVTEEEVNRYYQKNRRDFGGAAVSSVAAAIRQHISEQQRQTELARWISELRKRSHVMVLVDLTAQAGDGNDP